MSIRRASLLLLLATSLFTAACKKDGAAGAAAASGSAQLADVDCDKMMDHMVEVMIADGTEGKSDAEVTAMKEAMKAKRPSMIEACVKEKPTKPLTPTQYACLLATKHATELAGCMGVTN